MLGIDYDDLLGAAVGFNGVGNIHGDEYVRCGVCGFGGCDLRIVGCGCTLHARCTHLPASGAMANCPMCTRPSNELVLLPMSFREIDEARKAALALANNNRGRKRKSMNGDNSELERVAHDLSEKSVDRRTGRWTQEEMAYVDAVIEKFELGQLPIVDGIKLNDFLSNILKSKQSRLTKKMKNAKLSTRAFKRTTGYIVDPNEAKKFSDLEDAFYYSIQDQKERAEIKFHMQKEWRDMFSHYCVRIGQTIDVDQWLSSIEELDRRVSMSKDAARRAKRKFMIGNALRQDGLNPDKGVFIDRTGVDSSSAGNGRSGHVAPETEEFLAALSEKAVFDDLLSSTTESNSKRSKVVKIPPNPSPFLARALAYILRYKVPFEHVDAWVPSFVPSQPEEVEDPNNGSTCRLCYAGCATSETHVKERGQPPVPMTPEEHFNLNAFGEYSQKFSFDVGCGLPGRVYQTGIPSWEQSVHNAPLHHFERCGGALEWGIKTVVGIPIASPTVGRIVIILYSRFDREKDPELVGRLSEEFTKLLPTPAWKLVIDLGNPCNQPQQAAEPEVNAVTSCSQVAEDGAVDQNKKDSRIDEIISILGEHMPSDPSSNMSNFIQGFMTLRLLLLRPQLSWNAQDNEVIRIMVGSYSSYSSSGRARKDIALLLARDYMFLMQARNQQPVAPPPMSSSNNTTSLSAPHSYGMQYDVNAPSTSPYQNTVSSGSNLHQRDNLSIIST